MTASLATFAVSDWPRPVLLKGFNDLAPTRNISINLFDNRSVAARL